jgi:hypothetical protein
VRRGHLVGDGDAESRAMGRRCDHTGAQVKIVIFLASIFAVQNRAAHDCLFDLHFHAVLRRQKFSALAVLRTLQEWTPCGAAQDCTKVQPNRENLYTKSSIGDLPTVTQEQ